MIVSDISPTYQWKKLTPDDGKHYFFGYYDRIPWNRDQTKHLALRVDQDDRIPERGETAELGYVTPDKQEFVSLTTTRAWCHQQGCMNLWLKHRPDCFVYNDYEEETDRIVARIFEVGKGIVGKYERPIYTISPDGRWAASLDFARIPRRGYSYADAILPAEKRIPDLDNDGIFLMDLYTGESKLIVSYRQMEAIHPVSYMLPDVYWWLNHIIFNCDSTQLLFLFRCCKNPITPWAPMWHTYMYTVNLDGSNLQCTLPQVYWKGMISHQIWGRTPDEILIDCKWADEAYDYVVFDNRIRPPQAKRIAKGQGPMGHLVFSPDGEWMLADTYIEEGYQSLALVKAATGEVRVIGKFRNDGPFGETRCDLHPRWSADGSKITVDAKHDGKRAIYYLECDEKVKF